MIEAVPLTATSLLVLQFEFEQLHRDKLVPMQDGSGTGRAGYPSGWIENGVSLYRPWQRTDKASVMEGTGAGLHAAIMQIHAGDRDYGYIHQVIINRLAPGGVLSTHIDGPPYFSRWHLPIISDGTWFDEGEPWEEGILMQEGFWYGPISYWKPHATRNDTNRERVHAIVDFGPELTP